MSGKPIDAKTKPTEAMARLASEKLRSRKSDSGMSGSRVMWACHHTKTAPMTRPAAIIAMIVGDQSNACPSWMPKTISSRATPLSTDAEPVEGVVVDLERRHQPPGEPEPDDADRDVDEEDPLPPGDVDEHATEDRPDEGRDAGGGTPQAHRRTAALAREDPGDHGHRLRRHRRGAEPLEHPRRDQHPDAPGHLERQSAPQRGDGEDDEAAEVHPLGAEPVAQPPGDQDRDGIGQQVGAGHPDHVVDRGAVGRVGLEDRGRRHRHDRHVDQDHEEADAQGAEGGPRTDVVPVGRVGLRVRVTNQVNTRRADIASRVLAPSGA